MFGESTKTYGLQDVSCYTCSEHTMFFGNGTGNTDASMCLTEPGYGLVNGSTVLCDYGTWSAGGNIEPCQPCPLGFNTSVGGGPTEAIQGAVSPQDCVLAAGWTVDGSNGIKQCQQGW